MGLEQKKFISDKLGALGNFVVVALAFGQFISKDTFKFDIFIFGLAFCGVCYSIGYLLLKEAN